MITIRDQNDDCVQAVADALQDYAQRHVDADVVVYRQNSASVRVRIIDPDFAGVSKADRHDAVWASLADLPEEQQSEISMLLLLTPDEAAVSFANEEFENPIPSQL